MTSDDHIRTSGDDVVISLRVRRANLPALEHGIVLGVDDLTGCEIELQLIRREDGSHDMQVKTNGFAMLRAPDPVDAREACVQPEEGVPHDRLTRIVDAMATAMTTHPEYQEGQDRAVVFMDSDFEGVGGLVLFGYENHNDAISAIFNHLTAVFAANGQTLRVIPISRMGEG